MSTYSLDTRSVDEAVATPAAARAGDAGRLKRASRSNVLLRGIWLALAYVLVTAGLLTGLLWQLREEAIDARKRELSAFAQLASGHTFEVTLTLEQSLRLAEVSLMVATESGIATQESIGPMLREVVRGSRSLEDVVVLDSRGRVVYQATGTGAIGSDWSDRPYFSRLQGSPARRFEVTAPTPDGSGGSAAGMSIPAVHAWYAGSGQFAGVIVGLMAPEVFDKAWTFDSEIDGLSIALAGADGRAIMRRPFVPSLVGQPLAGPDVLTELALDRPAGVLEVANPEDGHNELVAYRRLAAYPDLVMFVAQPTSKALSDWSRIAWISGGCWILASAALAGLGLWLAREMKARGALESRYQALFNSIPYPVVVADHESGRLVACNAAAAEKYGAPFDDPRAADALLPADFAVLRARRDDFSREFPTLIEGQHHTDRQGQPIDVELTIRLIDHNNRPADLVVAVDVTDRLKADRERRSAEDQLRQSQKMEALGQLTGGIAHDFNNVLMVIADTADEIGEIEGLPQDARRAVDRIVDSTERAAELTRKMLAFSRRQPLRARPTDINDLVADTGRLLRRTLGEHIEIDSILADDLWAVDIDPVQLETSLVNLCLNARDAMPKGGRVLIETANVSLDTERAETMPGATAGDFVMIAVSDTGHGIPPADLGKVFEPFFTTKASGTGTGLGLSTIYGFIRQSNGHIEAESDLDRGTTFRLYLPRHASGAPRAERERRSPIAGGSERILVVEDDMHVRASVVRQLSGLGYDVSSAHDGPSGLAAFSESSFDLMLTDVVMPGGMTGKVLADEVAKRSPSTAIVFMSGYTDNALIFGGDIANDVRLLSKPFRKNDLAQMIRSALDDAGRAR